MYYLQTLDGGNKDHEPAKAIGAHVRGYFQFTKPTKPPHMALLNFDTLLKYFTHIKTKYRATTVADKLRAVRQAIEYVQFKQSEVGSSETNAKCQEVKERLQRWGRGLTKDIRKQ